VRAAPGPAAAPSSLTSWCPVYVKDTSTFSQDIVTQGYDGLIGLGPNSGSVVQKELDQDAAGDSPLNRIFSQARLYARGRPLSAR
jgi:hypothetical protein